MASSSSSSWTFTSPTAWHTPTTLKELNAFVDLIMDGQYTIQGPFHDMMCTTLAKGPFYNQLHSYDTALKKVVALENCFPYIEFRKALRPLDTVFGKNEAVMNILQDRGDQLAKIVDLEKALRYYTLAICFAPRPTASNFRLVHVYLKRAAALVALEFYESALEDLEMAFGLKYPPELELPLFQMKKNCQELIEPKESKRVSENDVLRRKFRDDVIAKVGYEVLESSDDGQPGLPDFISVELDDVKGRHLLVNVDLEPGTTVLLEKPYIALVLGQLKWRARFCSKCLKKTLNPIPCESCVFVTYCSEACRSEDFESGHKFECPLLPFLHCVKIPRTIFLCLKAICKAGPQTLQKLYAKSKAADHESDDFWKIPVQMIHSQADPYTRVLNQMRHTRTTDTQFACWLAIALAILLRLKTSYFDLIEESEKLKFETFVASVIVHHSESFPYNTVAMTGEVEIGDVRAHFDKGQSSRETQIASGIYPCLNLMNHSCSPTVFREQLPNGQIAIITSQAMKPGDELLHSYGVDFMKDAIEERHRLLEEYYRFVCDCVACTEQWPLFADLSKVGNTIKFVCPHCSDYSFGSPLKQAGLKIFESNWGTCDNCKNKFKMTPLTKETERYRVALEKSSDLVLNNKPLEAIPALKDCVAFFQKKTCQPSLPMLIAQARLCDSYDLVMNTMESRQEEQPESKFPLKSCVIV